MNGHQFIVRAASRLKRFSLTAGSAIASAMLIAGCIDSSADRQANFLVVDIISVARALGRDENIQQKLQDANALLNDQLTQISTNLQQQLKDEQSRLDESKSQAGREKIDNLTLQTQLKLRQSQLLAKQKSDEFRSKLLLEFREEVLAAARDIAKARRVLSVQIANNDLLWYDPSIDITADVIKVLRASESKSKPSESAQKQETSPKSESAAPDQSSENSAEINQLNRLMDSIADEPEQKPFNGGIEPDKNSDH